MKTLTTQGYDGSLSASQRTQIVDEINELNTEINATAARTKFNGNNLIASTVSGSMTTGGVTLAALGTITAVNANASMTGTFTLASGSASVTLTGVVSSTYNGVVSSTTYSQVGTVSAYSAMAGGYSKLNFDQVGISLDYLLLSAATSASDVGSAFTGKVITLAGTSNSDLYFQGGSDISTPNMVVYDAINIRTDSTTGGLQAMNNVGGQVSVLNSYTSTHAQTIWATAFSTMGTYVDAAVDLVSEQRSVMGALTNRISYINQNLEAYSTNLQSSRSAIMDTDFAAETAKLTKGQIMQQAATAMLAQANQMPNVVLSLLK
jgi:flagellin